MHKYLVINVKTKASVTVDLEEAARISQLDPDDIEWVLENYGVCETEDHKIAEIVKSERDCTRCQPAVSGGRAGTFG